jgi:hypothetical protein
MRAIELPDWPDASAQGRSVQHIQSHLYGAIPDSTLADVTLLDHFGSTLNATEWHEHFVHGNTPVAAVCVHPDGTMEEITWQRECVTPGVFEERHVAYWDTTGTEPNAKACELAETDGLKGDVVLLLCIEDDGFMRRKRFVPSSLISSGSNSRRSGMLTTAYLSAARSGIVWCTPKVVVSLEEVFTVRPLASPSPCFLSFLALSTALEEGLGAIW